MNYRGPGRSVSIADKALVLGFSKNSKPLERIRSSPKRMPPVLNDGGREKEAGGRADSSIIQDQMSFLSHKFHVLLKFEPSCMWLGGN
jgi:hypothetical protein